MMNWKKKNSEGYAYSPTPDRKIFKTLRQND